MWTNNILSGWKRAWQHTSYQQLAIALGLSVLLHMFLIGKFQINVSNLAERPQVIEARLLLKNPVIANPMPKPMPKPAVVKPAADKPTLVAPAMPTEAITTESTLVNVAPETEQESAPVIVKSTTSEGQQTVSNLVPTDAALVTSAATTALSGLLNADENTDAPVDLDIIVNPNAYQYVETTFDVRTDTGASVGSKPAGKAVITYELTPNGEQYQLKSLMQASGLAALLISDLLQISHGVLTNTGLQPKYYLYQFGNNKNKTYSADFDWQQKKLSLHGAKGNQTLALVAGTQDLLSFMYQFMFVPPLQNMQLSITNGKRLGSYDYVFESEEIIATKMGNLNTIHISRQATNGDEKTELWLALDYQYVPVKIRKSEKEGKVYELLVTSLKTEKPAN